MNERVRPSQVFIAEESEYDDSLGRDVWTGRFFAHFEGRDGSHRDGPFLVSADEAIEWGRRQAEIVQIRVGNQCYQAGARPHPDCADEPRWPPPVPVRRRSVANEHA